MLKAIVLHLQPVTKTRLPISRGSLTHAAAMDLLLRLDPFLSHTLHQLITLSHIYTILELERMLGACSSLVQLMS